MLVHSFLLLKVIHSHTNHNHIRGILQSETFIKIKYSIKGMDSLLTIFFMKSFEKILGLALALSLTLGLLGPISFVSAATTPALGLAETFGVLADTYTNTLVGTTIDGDLGYTTPPFLAPTVTGTTHDETPTYFTAGTDQATALSDLNLEVCTPIAGALDAVVVGINAPGTFPPGCYSMIGAMNVTVGTTVTLDLTAPGGVGSTWIFRPSGALNTAANVTISLMNGASACDVFWTPIGLTTLGADNTFAGTIIDDAGITIGANTEVAGRALAFGGTVTTGTGVTITTPACAVPPPPPSSGSAEKGYINVVKNVINDNGGTKVVSDFPLLVNGLFISSGVTNVFGASNNESFEYKVTETQNAGYTQSFSGDCDAQGIVRLDPDESLFCIITNDDIGAPTPVAPVPPLIEVVKVPNPFALPGGPGLVEYTYTLRNIGTVPASNITMVGDTCSPIVLQSGDTNNNAILDLTETWVHTCSTTLTETHTNTVVATGWANGISAVDIASATVIVGSVTVPPIIHITKTPNKFTLTAGGGMITYTKKVTNPGTVALSNVQVSDDKCPAVKYISGDTDLDNMLDTSETWTYTCSTNITKTTTNTAVATGVANGQIARDFALATVTVAGVVPALPNTGAGPTEMNLLRNIALVAGLLMITSAAVIAYRRKQAL